MPPVDTINTLTAIKGETAEAAVGALLAQKPFVETIQGVPHVFYPQDSGAWEYKNLEALLPSPARKSGAITAHDVDSFITLIKRHGSLATANVYLDVDYINSRVNAVAIFNDHNDSCGAPGWRDFRAQFSPRMSEEWKRWSALDRKPIEQIKLAHFLEENVADIVKPEDSKLPTGAEVLTFVSALEEVRKVKYGNAVNLQNGLTRLEFVEDNDTATKGKLELFREFAIGIRPYFGGEGYSIRAFLRYRIERNTGAIVFWYELQRPDKILADATQGLIEKIQADAGARIIFGTP